ncbi:MAG TPA: DUF6765 family protein [Burkholderiaceae bacterium]|nr:DUF6765 family protein [Burkholderiaceae bacterium]
MPPRPLSRFVRRPAVRTIIALLTLLPQISAHGGLLDQIGGTQNSGCGVTMSCTPGGNTPGGPFPGTTPGGPAACTPSANGSTCGGSSGTASQSGQGGVDVGAGNPINLITGNKYQQEVDLPPLPGTLGIEIVRHYNSLSRDAGQLGWNWKLSYETDLYPGPTSLQVLQADGRRIIFSRAPKNPSLCQSANPADGKIDVRKNARGQEEFTWTWNNGKKLAFNAHGKLDAITAPEGQVLTLQRGLKGELLSVTDPQHRSLVMRYGTDPQGWRGIVAIESPVGRFLYSQTLQGKGIGNLAQVKYPGGAVTRSYHYSDAEPQTRQEPDKEGKSHDISYLHPNPHLLTGISVQGTGSDGKAVAQRIATWGYHLNGKAILSTHADNVDKVTLDYSEGDRTVLTNSLGQKTVYRHAIVAGEYRLLEAIGPGCALCGQTNVRYSWDSNGQLVMVTRLGEDKQAMPRDSVRYAYDKLGRLTWQARRSYDLKTGKPVGPWQWTQRYEYEGDAMQPVLMARPSVVPGKEYLTKIVYGKSDATRNLPVQITENGYVPSMDGKSVAEQISRTTRYRYNLNGQRIDTDGPLSNAKEKPGPDNSDITREEYDQDTKLATRIIAPGNVITEVLERDDALRPVKVRTSDGHSVQTVTLRLNWRGQPEEIRIDAALLKTGYKQVDLTQAIDTATQEVCVLRYQYDAEGRPTVVTLPGNFVTRLHYDAAGRLIDWILPDGSRIARQQNTEGRLERLAGFADAHDNTTALTSVQLKYDGFNHISEVRDTLGVRGRFQYTGFGQIAQLTNALDTSTQFTYDDHGLLRVRTLAADTPDAASLQLAYDEHGQPIRIVDANHVATERRYDDFGRKIAEISPDRGIQLFRYDPAGRIVARIDESQSATRYRYDHANRLMAVGADKQPELVQYRYDGMRLAEVIGTTDGKAEHAVERMQYLYDAWGQVTMETRWLAQSDAALPASQKNAPDGLTFVTRNGYDQIGRLQWQVLPDGHRLGYRYTAMDAAAGKHNSKSGQLSAILFDDQVVVSDIEQSALTGVTGYLNGNGIRQQIKIDNRGRIEQLQIIAQGNNANQRWWQRIKGWFAERRDATEQTIYSQFNRYDAADRLIGITRSRLNPGTGMLAQPVQEYYEYDHQDRLTQMETEHGSVTHLRYDRGGNRIGESIQPTTVLHTNAAPGAEVRGIREYTYRYTFGTNRLTAVTQSAQGDIAAMSVPLHSHDVAQLIRAAWFYHPTGVPLAQLQLAKAASGPDGNTTTGSRRIIYNSLRRPIAVHDEHNRLIARYRYNLQGERIAKTVYTYSDTPTLRRAAIDQQYGKQTREENTTYNLYRNQRLAAEADAQGHIIAHYIYLAGRPVAKIEMTPNTGWMHVLWKSVVTLGGTRPDGEPDAADSVAAVYAIHTDHLGTPQVVTDAGQRVVWQAETDAFGKAQVTYAAMQTTTGEAGKAFELNLRLPGQVYDRETGLHYNYYRDYDPSQGRYTTPDPMGLGGGMNPYAYVANNPLTNIDPLGLYQSDIHYYMTFFLAMAAGVDYSDARTIALATQYVDNNPQTRPLDDSTLFTTMLSPLWNQNQLARYHFVLWETGSDGQTVFSGSTDITQHSSTQLGQLIDASQKAPTKCARLQFFGEYLHAFEDTFAHRDRNNVPYGVNNGFGHGLSAGSNPDYTYDDAPDVTGPLSWHVRAERTLKMEEEVFDQLKNLYGDNTKARSWEEVKVVVEQFNKFKESEGDEKNFTKKFNLLNETLNQIGWEYKAINADGTMRDIDLFIEDKYDKNRAATNRDKYLCDKNNTRLRPMDYPGTILPETECPK